MDKDTSLELTSKVIDAAATAADSRAKVDINAAAILAETNKCTATELVQAESEAALRNHALKLSSAVTIIIVVAQIYFCYVGKVLVIPDIVWAVILSPWLGFGSAKMLETIIGMVRRGKS